MSANQNSRLDWSEEPTSLLTDERLHAGLAVLWRAYVCAQDTGANLWDLSLPTKRLFEAGMTANDLRWLVTEGLAESGEETTANGDSRRTFHRNGGSLSHRSRLILTPGGASVAEHVFGEAARSSQATFFAPAPAAAAFPTKRKTLAEKKMPETKPRWDMIRRELSFAGSIVKRFRVPAKNQETILAVFEEEGWAEHIHDPLPVSLNIDAPTRLHDAINRLNRCQINPLVRFHGDGKGTGVFWKLCA